MSAFNGSGTYVVTGTGLPFVTGTPISSTVANQLNTDLATGLSTVICKDGQTTTTAMVPFGDFGISTSIIKFPVTQVPSADLYTLDDYREGTFTPSLAFGGAAVGITYGTQAGVWTKIGNRLFMNGTIVLTSKGSSTGNAAISGLPAAPVTVSATTPIFGTALAAGVTTALVGLVVATSTIMTPYSYSAGAATQLTDASFSNTTTIAFSANYSV